jgi:hypothetical protein
VCNTVLVVLRHAQVELDLGAMERLVERHAHGGFIVAAGHGRLGVGAAAEPLAAPESGKQVGQVDIVERRLAAREVLLPVGWRPEFLSLRVAAQLVVGRALLGILQRFVGFGHRLELLLGILFLRYVGMELARELAIGLLDGIRARVPGDTEYCVIVLVFHCERLQLDAPGRIGKSYRSSGGIPAATAVNRRRPNGSIRPQA